MENKMQAMITVVRIRRITGNLILLDGHIVISLGEFRERFCYIVRLVGQGWTIHIADWTVVVAHQ